MVGRRSAKLLGAVAAAVALSACNLASVAYNQAPTWLHWRIDGLLSLTDEQSATLRPALAQWHAWHRTEHLPRYAQALREWQTLALQDVQPAQVCRWVGDVRRWAAEAGDRMAPVLAQLAPTLSPSQLERWTRMQARRNTEFAQEFTDPPGAVSPERLKRAVDRAEMFYGPLTSAQRDWLTQRLAHSRFRVEQVLAERQARHADALAAVAAIQAGAAPVETVQQVWRQFQQSPRNEYRAYSEAAFQDLCTQFAELHNQTTPAQRQLAVQKLQSFEQDARALASR